MAQDICMMEIVFVSKEQETEEEALADVKSAIQFHIETFGPEAVEGEPSILEVFVAEAGVAV